MDSYYNQLNQMKHFLLYEQNSMFASNSPIVTFSELTFSKLSGL